MPDDRDSNCWICKVQTIGDEHGAACRISGWCLQDSCSFQQGKKIPTSIIVQDCSRGASVLQALRQLRILGPHTVWISHSSVTTIKKSLLCSVKMSTVPCWHWLGLAHPGAAQQIQAEPWAMSSSLSSDDDWRLKIKPVGIWGLWLRIGDGHPLNRGSYCQILSRVFVPAAFNATHMDPQVMNGSNTTSGFRLGGIYCTSGIGYIIA